MFRGMWAIGFAAGVAAKGVALGVNEGRLAPCPHSPNCVSSQATDEQHHVAPMHFSISRAQAVAAAKSVIAALPRTRIVATTDNYIHAECTSAVFRFVDDLELFFDDADKQIHVRSAARVGYWDLGVNRRRVEKLRAALAPRVSAPVGAPGYPVSGGPD